MSKKITVTPKKYVTHPIFGNKPRNSNLNYSHDEIINSY